VQEAQVISAGLKGKYAGAEMFCDIGGGHGYLLAALLRDRPNAKGIVFELPEGAAGRAAAVTRDLGDRCSHVAGNMFESVPAADIYAVKQILHDWDDASCRKILSVARHAAKPGSRLLILEWVVPDASEPHLSKLLDIHMLC